MGNIVAPRLRGRVSMLTLHSVAAPPSCRVTHYRVSSALSAIHDIDTRCGTTSPRRGSWPGGLLLSPGYALRAPPGVSDNCRISDAPLIGEHPGGWVNMIWHHEGGACEGACRRYAGCLKPLVERPAGARNLGKGNASIA